MVAGLAAANLAGAAFGGYPASGSFARSAVSSEAGGITGAISCLLSPSPDISLVLLATHLAHFQPYIWHRIG